MNTYYATFGCGQPLRGHYVIIEAESYAKAHILMVSQFNRMFCAVYDKSYWHADKSKSIAEEYGYELLTTLRERNFEHFLSGGDYINKEDI